jgi:hypothetical protein
MTISVEQEVATAIRREAARDGVDISTWLSRTARREALRRAYAEAAAERQDADRLDTNERLIVHATRRAAVRRYLSEQDRPNA